MGEHIITLYVKSAKKPVGNEQVTVPHVIGGQVYRSVYNQPYPDPADLPSTETMSSTKYESSIPEEQEKALETVKEAAGKYGFDVNVVEVSRENSLHEFVDREIHKLGNYPVLVTPSGRKLHSFSEKEVEAFLHEESKEQHLARWHGKNLQSFCC